MPTISPQSPTASRKYIVVHESDGVTRQYFYLPDTMKSWPWPRRMNPHREAAAAESMAWFKALKPFSPRSLHAYDMSDCGLYSALAYPDVSHEHLRIAIDMMAVLFVIDEYTDVESAPEARQTVEVAIDALRHPDKARPEGEFIVGEIIRQFWARARAIATPEAAERFVDIFIDYLRAVIVQAEDRDNHTALSIEDYLKRRRWNIGSRPTFVLGVLHLSIPHEAFHHPVIKELEDAILDLLIVDNDIVSYNKEQATGDDTCNILTIVMRHLRVDFDSAMEWAIGYHKDVESRFLDSLLRVPSFGPAIDAAIQEYVAHLANWPRANICWSFECGRYFGTKGSEVQKTRMVPVFPKRARNAQLRRELVEVPLVEELEQTSTVANEDIIVEGMGHQG
ncbi:isoprenoid synthase domain-containing protein [Ganoderma leucocontextum]|nr:isoprenoid synthase domain-containing protein [Ganoderma leucocontextum]